MIFYTIKHPDGRVVDWAGTQADARAACKALDDVVNDDTKPTWEEHDVPTDKPSLLAWLKKYAVGLGESQVEQLAEVLYQNTKTPHLDQLVATTKEHLGLKEQNQT